MLFCNSFFQFHFKQNKTKFCKHKYESLCAVIAAIVYQEHSALTKLKSLFFKFEIIAIQYVLACSLGQVRASICDFLFCFWFLSLFFWPKTTSKALKQQKREMEFSDMFAPARL